jgi:anti-sigma factor RsiW
MDHAQAVGTHAVERYLLDEMAEVERHAFEEHYFSCPACAEDVRMAGLMREGARAGFAGTQAAGADRASTVVPFRPARSWSAQTWLPWAAAAVLALAVGYQSFLVIPALRETVVGPQALSPLTLRPASRGAAPTIARPDAGPITFAVELAGVAAGDRLTYDLLTAGGQVAASGAAPAPSPGTPLLLLIPRSAFRSTGSYTLSVRAADSGAAAGEYRFIVTE